MPRYNELTTEKRNKFLACLADAWSPTKAAKAVGVSREMVFKHRENDERFARAWEDAIDQAADKMEDIAIERASTKSDTMLIVMLKAMRPKRFIERQAIDITQNVSITVTRAQEELKAIPRDQLLESLALLEAPTIENAASDDAGGVTDVEPV